LKIEPVMDANYDSYRNDARIGSRGVEVAADLDIELGLKIINSEIVLTERPAVCVLEKTPFNAFWTVRRNYLIDG
jgi:hypothetical protein